MTGELPQSRYVVVDDARCEHPGCVGHLHINQPQLFNLAGRPSWAQAIKRAVADEYGLEVEQLQHRSRMGSDGQARTIAMLLYRQLADVTDEQIGREFLRHRSTAAQAIARGRRLLAEDAEFGRSVRRCRRAAERLRATPSLVAEIAS